MDRPDFILVPTQLLSDTQLTPTDRIIYGYVYWLVQLKNERCNASNRTLAELAIVTMRTAQNSLTRLEKRGYVQRLFINQESKHREEIVPLVKFNMPRINVRTPRSNIHSPTNKRTWGLRRNDDHNNKSNKKSIEIETPLSPKLGDAVKDFIQYRKELKKPLTPTGLERLAKKLCQYDETTAIAMLDQTMANGWQGLVELKEQKFKKGIVDV